MITEDKEQWKKQLANLQEPVQFIQMAMFTLLRSQKEQFSGKALYHIYLACIKQLIDKDFKKLQEDNQ